MFTFKVGLLLGLSIIISIGAQNLFVIRQCLRKEYPYLSALICFICDFCMIILGVTGVSALLIQIPWLKKGLLAAGIIFLIVYGCLAIKRGLDLNTVKLNLIKSLEAKTGAVSLKKLVFLGLSFSLLNPQAILDTMIIIGGTANHYVNELKYLFIFGTITASFLWFFGLAIGTNYFAKKLMNVKFWCLMEILSGLSMIIFAGKFFYNNILAVKLAG